MKCCAWLDALRDRALVAPNHVIAGRYVCMYETPFSIRRYYLLAVPFSCPPLFRYTIKPTCVFLGKLTDSYDNATEAIIRPFSRCFAGEISAKNYSSFQSAFYFLIDPTKIERNLFFFKIIPFPQFKIHSELENRTKVRNKSNKKK